MSNNTMEIRLPTIEHVQNFVDTVGQFPEDISLSCGKYIVDAKSIMGIFSLDLRLPLTVTVESDDPAAVFAALAPFRRED